MSAPGLVGRLWKGLWRRQGLGRIVIKFYPRGREASITVAPGLAGLSRRSWHWLYLQHLAASLAAIGEAQERMRLVVAARAMAEDFVSRSSWPHVIGEAISDAAAGAAQIVPEREGGVALTTQVVQRGDGMPAVRLAWSPPQARERVASSNLVLLVHVMRAATHPLEQYEIFKKIVLFAEHCERTGCPRERATLQGSALYAVVHADVTEMASPGGPLPRKVAVAVSAEPDGKARPRRSAPAGPGGSRGLSALRSFRDRLASPDPFWKRPRFAMGAAALLWTGLALAAFFLPRLGAPVPPRPIAGLPPATRSHDAGSAPDRKEIRPPQVPLAAATAPRPASRVKAQPDAAANAHRPRPAPAGQGEQNETPRFRVVSGTLALGVAEHRTKVLAEQGVDAFVAERTGKLGRLQYGAYHFREFAEEDARHFRAQGYTAVVIPW